MVRAMCILNREIVQVKFPLNLAEHSFAWLMESNPDELIGLIKGFMNLINRNVLSTPTIDIGCAVDNLAHDTTS